MNQAQFIGNLTADAVVRASRDGQSQYVTFTVAVSQRQPDGTQTALYVECAKNGDNKNLLPYLTKGKSIWVQGRISAHAYADRQGQPRASLDLRVYDLELCGGRSGEQAATAAAAQPQPVPQPQPQPVTPQEPFSRTPRQDGSLFPGGIEEQQRKNKMQHESDLPF